LSVDPASGSGVVRALRTARQAADAVSEFLAQPSAWPSALGSYEADRDAECTDYLLERGYYYGAERRFNGCFWARRHRLDPPTHAPVVEHSQA
jgi:hypothetical protein